MGIDGTNNNNRINELSFTTGTNNAGNAKETTNNNAKKRLEVRAAGREDTRPGQITAKMVESYVSAQINRVNTPSTPETASSGTESRAENSARSFAALFDPNAEIDEATMNEMILAMDDQDSEFFNQMLFASAGMPDLTKELRI